MHNAAHVRSQEMKELQTLTVEINGALEQENVSNLKKINDVATLLEGNSFELNETMLADIMLSVFKAGKLAGKDEFKQKIAKM